MTSGTGYNWDGILYGNTSGDTIENYILGETRPDETETRDDGREASKLDTDDGLRVNGLGVFLLHLQTSISNCEDPFSEATRNSPP